ncbi:polysaccharide deacetylase family protein [Halorubrum trueperi]|uniref:Polysaccharide deacetylase family protein n=1 Tax=Halorubrum trueperi TaxID=2004704 RepID=A0ABD5UQ35_9EURY
MGTFVLSIDAELGWGRYDDASPPSDRLESGRAGWATLLDLLDTYNVPATWAVVGHLFLPACDRVHATHPAGDEWFARERDEWADRPDLRFAPDLIRAIDDANADHEIGCHSFTHVDFGDDSTTTEIARAELVAALEAAASSPVSAAMTSVAFPNDSVGHRDVLAEWGFTCYRGPAPDRERFAPSLLRRLGDATVGPPPIVEPTIDEFGLVNVPASLHLFELDGPARRICERVVGDPAVAAVRRGIDAVTEEDGVFHVWLRPNDLIADEDVERLRTVLAHVAHCRDLAGLEVRTMREVSRRVESRVEPSART